MISKRPVEDLDDAHAVYLDTPALAAVRQISPFFDNGIFDPKRCTLYIRRRAVVQLQRAFTTLPANMPVQMISGTTLPARPGSVVFYPFNAQSNMNAVTQRRFHHVLTLHGESNKLASFRPAARLYDYVCVAGPVAIDRYLDNQIFTTKDVDGGRLVQMGDSFVQKMNWLEPARESDEEGVIFYCPTWEGFGTQTANYSSVVDCIGFEQVKRAAASLGVRRIVIKPHPYQGLLRFSMWQHFFRGVRALRDDGFEVALALDDVPPPIKALIRFNLKGIRRISESSGQPVKVRLAITDVSGMEAVLLVARIPAVVTQVIAQPVPTRLKEILAKKTLGHGCDVAAKTERYLDQIEAIDGKHRAQIFGFQTPGIEKMQGSERMSWLSQYCQADPFWRSR